MQFKIFENECKYIQMPHPRRDTLINNIKDILFEISNENTPDFTILNQSVQIT